MSAVLNKEKNVTTTLIMGLSHNPHLFSLVLETIKYFPISEGINCIKL